MLDKANQCFTKVKAATSSICPNTSQTFVDAPSDSPFLFYNQLDNPTIADDLDNNENAVKPMVEITVYTTGEGKLTNGKKIMNLADTEMRSMGYKRTFGPQQVTNLNDNTICRLISRYTRIIGSGDTIQ